MSDLKFWNFASAWISKKNSDVINVQIDNSDKNEVEIFAVHKPSGEKIPLTSFFLKRNDTKDKPGANPNWPDYQVTFTTGD